jgi:hypothetical protein
MTLQSVPISAERRRLRDAAAAAEEGAYEREERAALRERAEPPPGRFDDEDAQAAPQDATSPQARINILDADAIWAPLPEPVYITSQILQASNLTELVAYGSSGKSWMGAELCVAVAAGVKAFDRFDTKQGSTLYIDWESGSFEMRRRFQLVSRGRDIEGPVPGVFLTSMPQLYMTSADFEEQVMRLADGRSLLVFDTLKAGSPGIDENSSDMRFGLDAIKRVTERTGCAALVLMHSKKVSGSITSIDPREAGRGSSAIFDAGDAVLHVIYQEGKPLLVQQTKGRGGKFVDPFSVSIVDAENGGVRVVGADVEKSSEDDWDEVCTRVLEIVRANPGSSGRLIRGRAKGTHVTRVLGALEYLERQGAIRNTGSKQSAKWFPTERTADPDPWKGEFDDR